MTLLEECLHITVSVLVNAGNLRSSEMTA